MHKEYFNPVAKYRVSPDPVFTKLPITPKIHFVPYGFIYPNVRACHDFLYIMSVIGEYLDSPI